MFLFLFLLLLLQILLLACRYLALKRSAAEYLIDAENLGYPLRGREQVAELNVQLREYQLQTVQWALDQEHRNGGMMTHLYAPIPRTTGV